MISGLDRRLALAWVAGVLAASCHGEDEPAGSATDGATTTTSGAPSTSSPDPSATGPAGVTATVTASASSGGDGSTAGSTTTEPADTATTGLLCGNGVEDPLEECDLGPDNDDHGECTHACKRPQCGDGLLQPGHGEACDHGNDNNDNGTCTRACQLPTCGDGHVQPSNGEACDDGVNDGSYGTCDPACELPERCGDGVQQPEHEECDDGRDDDTQDGLCSIACRWNGNIVFVASETVTGALGGLTGADAKCNQLAKAAGLVLLESDGFKAWLSDGSGSPATRMNHSEERYMLRDGTVIAADWSELVDGDLAEAIALTEYGEPFDPAVSVVWTSTTVTGKLKDEDEGQDESCEGWTSAAKGRIGWWGSASSAKTSWTEMKLASCATPARLYCIGQ